MLILLFVKVLFLKFNLIKKFIIKILLTFENLIFKVWFNNIRKI